MTSRKRREDEVRALCAALHEDDGIDPREEKRRQAPINNRNRKDDQLCKQVSQALTLALANLPEADLFSESFIQNVTPAPNAGRLRAVVITCADHVQAVQSALSLRAGLLRAEVARSITRRRAPEIVFQVIAAEVNHE